MVPVLYVLSLAMYAVVPVTAFTGVRRYMRARSVRNGIFLPSLIGFWLGLSSVAIGFIAMVWGGGGYRFYDPDLMRFYGIGILLSLAGAIAGLGGVWKKNPLRWHAPALSFGMFLLWLVWVAGE